MNSMALPRYESEHQGPYQLPTHQAPHPQYPPHQMPYQGHLNSGPRQGYNDFEHHRPPRQPNAPYESRSPRWESMSNGSRSSPGSPSTHQPQADRYRPSHGYPQDPRSGPPRGPPRHPRPRHDSPSRHPRPPLSAKAFLPDMRHREGMANFSRPRGSSVHHHQPPDLHRPHHSNSPSSSQPRQQFSGHPPPTPPQWQRQRHPSDPMSRPPPMHHPLRPPPTPEDPYSPDFRNPHYRRGPPPTQPPVPPSYDRIPSSTSAASAPPSINGPRFGADTRTSFRSQRTTSTAPGTATTERSSTLTRRTSLTSIEPGVEEPSVEDVMDMYGLGFEALHNSSPGNPTVSQPTLLTSHIHYDPRNTLPPVHNSANLAPPPSLLRSPRRSSFQIIEDEAILAPNVLDRNRRPSAATIDGDDDLKPPPSRTDVDAEIRLSKLIFASPDFMASIPHMVGGQEASPDDDCSHDKRDSGKSIESDPSEHSQGLKYNSNRQPLDSAPASRPTTAGSSPTSQIRTFNLGTTNSNLPTVAPTSQPVTEDPESRDRYGFKKETHYVTRKQYDTWNKGYTEYLARRRKKWVAFHKENALMTDRPNRFPALSPKTRRFVRKGIPPEWRGAAWFYYAGGPAILAKHAGLYEQLLFKRAKRVDVEAIERDLHRTFPDNIKFKPPGAPENGYGSDRASVYSEHSEGVTGTDDEPAKISALRRVLWAFSIYNPHIGYCQSLNFIAGMLLLFVETEEQTFWLLNVITRIYLPGTHEMSLEGSKVDLSVLMTEIRTVLPSVWDKIGGDLEGGEASCRPQTSRSIRRPTRSARRNMPSLSSERLPPITLSMTAWFMSCYIGTLPVETTLRVWDIFFCEGSKTLFNVALAIFKTGESEIKAIKDPMEMFGAVQSMPRSMINANALIEACFKKKNGVANLSQGTIDELRQDRRIKAQQERMQLKEAGKAGISGSKVKDVESEVTRKGTLFGMKKRSVSRTRTVKS